MDRLVYSLQCSRKHHGHYGPSVPLQTAKQPREARSVSHRPKSDYAAVRSCGPRPEPVGPAQGRSTLPWPHTFRVCLNYAVCVEQVGADVKYKEP
ncbi:hypothetical protein QQF64_029202 [Cirrhinus molitorella]|uniref:Uncharacterized protein n=1 Tax=Cirrhinus molitorella TaxID=172907 RepID=A0ABR3N9E2_9TELE